MDNSSYFTRLSKILYRGIENFIAFGKHSVGDDRKRLVVWWRAKKAIYGGSNGLHGCVFVIRAVFLPCGGVETFSSSLDMSSIRFENFEATVLDSHSVNNKVRIFVVVTQL